MSMILLLASINSFRVEIDTALQVAEVAAETVDSPAAALARLRAEPGRYAAILFGPVNVEGAAGDFQALGEYLVSDGATVPVIGVGPRPSGTGTPLPLERYCAHLTT